MTRLPIKSFSSTEKSTSSERPACGSASAAMLKPESGMDSGRCRRSSLIDRAIRLVDTFAAASACAVRSTMRSWKENCHALRGPRVGETKPARTSVRIVLRERRSIFCTSRTP